VSALLYDYPVVVFDLDGTLLRGTTVSLLLAEWLGQSPAVAELERAFRAGEISNRVVADTQAAWLGGRTTTEVANVLTAGPWIDGMAQTLNALCDAGVHVLLGTITWSFAAEILRRQYGFSAVSGTEMLEVNGVLAGSVSRYFDEHDKLRFVESWCAERGYAIADVAAIGDSRSDVPLFRRAGLSIALNATTDARAVATHHLDTDDLRNVLALLAPNGCGPVARVR
jgi:phosphoserine phosphatase